MSRNEALSYVENTMYFETSDLKIHFLMIRNKEITTNAVRLASYAEVAICLFLNRFR